MTTENDRAEGGASTSLHVGPDSETRPIGEIAASEPHAEPSRETRRAEDDIAAAQSFIASASRTLPTQQAAELEKRLAKLGDQTLVRNLRVQRIKLDCESADEILSNAREIDVFENFELGRNLKQYTEFGLARRLSVQACGSATPSKHGPIYTKLFQLAALCTYKDPDLPLDWRLDRAYDILGKAEALSETRNPETLGLAGAIFKRKWEADGKRQSLERSLFYYLKGYAQGAPAAAREDVLKYLRENPGAKLDATKDLGYTGINAAFVLDLLAEQEQAEAQCVGVIAISAKARRADAARIREEIVRSVAPLANDVAKAWVRDEWWFYATIGEALFGLERYDEAVEWLCKKPEAAGLHIALDVRTPAGLQVPEWEYESTARQLARIARLQFALRPVEAGTHTRMSEAEFERAPATVKLREILGGDEQAVRSAFRGKFGLGLSGGGFRAALFHVGVLARLAEIDALRHLEVLSCVSGGSIVGAYYYLEVRQLLQTKTDAEITRDDYMKIVQRIEGNFLKGVQRNIRTRVLAELSTNLKLAFSRNYSRTLRVGELYERELYSRVEDFAGTDGAEKQVTGPGWLPDMLARWLRYRRNPRLLRELRIRPRGSAPESPGQEFNPRRQNWRRKHKVPVLVLNATCLNTGHNWQFTASYMGEPPLSIQTDIDTNYRLRRLYYKDAPKGYPPISLGQAVAASSCVPGLFEPLVLDNLYPDDPDGSKRRISVRLVDGGVCDNQGISSLLENDCSVMLVSDGSGQMEAQDVPGTNVLAVPLRANSILQARVREAEYNEIAARRRSRLLRGLMFVHLKQDLVGKALAWRDCPPDQKRDEVYDTTLDPAANDGGMTRYGIARDTQLRLASVRTDLDSFCDAEAYALMTSGYKMASRAFRGDEPAVDGFADAPPNPWAFLEIEPALKPRGDHKANLDKLLDVAASTTFKIWQLLVWLKVLAGVLAVAAVSALMALIVTRWDDALIPEISVGRSATWAIWFGVAALLTFSVRAIAGRRGDPLLKVVHWRDTVRNIAIGVSMSIFGFWLARLHLHVFDRLYLRYGKLQRFVSPPKP
jgi:predicted acylesterase/phospholipase RssA